MGSDQASSLERQTNRLMNANRNLTKIEKSVIPGAEKLVGLIGKSHKKNTIILAFVISLCLVCVLHSLGFIEMLRKLSSTVSPVTNNTNNDKKFEQHSSSSPTHEKYIDDDFLEDEPQR